MLLGGDNERARWQLEAAATHWGHERDHSGNPIAMRGQGNCRAIARRVQCDRLARPQLWVNNGPKTLDSRPGCVEHGRPAPISPSVNPEQHLTVSVHNIERGVSCGGIGDRDGHLHGDRGGRRQHAGVRGAECQPGQISRRNRPRWRRRMRRRPVIARDGRRGQEEAGESDGQATRGLRSLPRCCAQARRAAGRTSVLGPRAWRRAARRLPVAHSASRAPLLSIDRT